MITPECWDEEKKRIDRELSKQWDEIVKPSQDKYNELTRSLQDRRARIVNVVKWRYGVPPWGNE